MGRKKKETYSFLDPLYDNLPDIIETTSLSDSTRSYIFAPSTTTILSDSHIIDTRTYETTLAPKYGKTFATENSILDLKKYVEEKEVGDVKVFNKPAGKYECIVACTDVDDLSGERVLKTLSAVKGKLMLDIAPIHIQKLECSMTPLVKKNIIQASKKLKMYGKKRPIIACFDEFGNRLPDKIELDTSQGVSLIIVDPKEYGDFYLELKAIEFPSGDYCTLSYPDMTWTSIDDSLPF